MAVSEQTPYIEYTANGITTSFALEFDCDNQDHLIVLVDDVEPVVGAWSFSNGAVVFNTAPENGKKITIQRNTPLQRNTDYQFYDNSFRPPSVNKDFDRIWLKLQEFFYNYGLLSNQILQEKIDRINGDHDLQEGINSVNEIVDKNTNDIKLLENIVDNAADTYLNNKLIEIEKAIDNAAATGAGANGWVDLLILLSNGRTQRDKNKDIQSVKDFGAIGDGTLHTVNEWTVVGSKIYYPDLAAIQVDYPHVTALTDSIDWAAAQKSINTTKIAYYPMSEGAYINNKTLQLNGNWDTVIGASKQVVVKNIGAGIPAVRLTKAYQKVQSIAILGNGGANGVGATTSHGIHLDNGTSTNFHDVSIRYHGGHGIYGSNGVWITKVNQCYIEHNLQDGINIVSPSGATFDQNGNSLSITDSTIAANGGNGVKWKAVALSISGSVLEANKGYGLLVTTVGYTASAFGISFVGNYTENNVLGELKFESTSTAIVTDVNIAGNYFYSIQTGGAIAAITFVGTLRSTRNVNIRSNSIATGGTVLNLVDGGNSFREDCTVDAGAYSVVNMTQCQLIQGNKTKSISGAFLSKGVTWTNPSGPSANFFSASNTDIYFPIDLQQAQALLDIKFYMTANMTATYSMAARLMSKDSTTGGAPVTEYSITLSSGSSGGNNLFTLTPTSSNLPIRIAANKSYYLHLTVSPPSTGSSIQIHDPILRFV